MRCIAGMTTKMMTSLKEMNLLQSQKMKNLIGRIRPFPQKTEKNHCRIRQMDRKTMKIFQKET